jgi:WhiB family transcriptional regulator, redox-sensing transcriptional regulator
MRRPPDPQLIADVTAALEHPDPQWWDGAECAGLDVNIFYPERGDCSQVTICGDCPVRVDCLAHAIATREQFGIWGGIAIRPRKTIARAIRAVRPDLVPAVLHDAYGDAGTINPDAPFYPLVELIDSLPHTDPRRKWEKRGSAA